MDKTETLPYNKALMEAIKDMVFIVSVEVDLIFRYAFLNRAVFERTDLTQNDTGRTFEEVHEQAASDLLNRQYRKVPETEDSLIYEDSYVSPSGEPYYSETTLTPLFHENVNCTHIVGVVKDMSNERLAGMESEEAWNV